MCVASVCFWVWVSESKCVCLCAWVCVCRCVFGCVYMCVCVCVCVSERKSRRRTKIRSIILEAKRGKFLIAFATYRLMTGNVGGCKMCNLHYTKVPTLFLPFLMVYYIFSKIKIQIVSEFMKCTRLAYHIPHIVEMYCSKYLFSLNVYQFLLSSSY